MISKLKCCILEVRLTDLFYDLLGIIEGLSARYMTTSQEGFGVSIEYLVLLCMVLRQLQQYLDVLDGSYISCTGKSTLTQNTY